MKSYLDRIKEAIFNIETNTARYSDWEHAERLLYQTYSLLEILPTDYLNDEDFATIDQILSQTRYKIMDRMESANEI